MQLYADHTHTALIGSVLSEMSYECKNNTESNAPRNAHSFAEQQPQSLKYHKSYILNMRFDKKKLKIEISNSKTTV